MNPEDVMAKGATAKGKRQVGLESQARMFPTPYGLSANQGQGGGEFDKAVRMWPSPRATDGEKGGPNQRGSKGDLALPSAVMLPTPAARDWKSGTGADHGEHAPPLSSVIGGQLNPHWVEWLMGFPIGWTALDASAMPLSRNKSSPSCKR